MSNFLPHDWWESSVFACSAGPFGLSSIPNDLIWENVDGNIETFIALAELLTDVRVQAWQHERLDWDLHFKKLLHKNRFHIR